MINILSNIYLNFIRMNLYLFIDYNIIILYYYYTSFINIISINFNFLFKKIYLIVYFDIKLLIIFLKLILFLDYCLL